MKKRFFYLMLLLVSPMTGYSQQTDMLSETQGSELPSEQTYQDIERFSNLPTLRSKPNDIEEGEKPQKVPLGGVDFSVLLGLGFSLLFYASYKTKQLKQ